MQISIHELVQLMAEVHNREVGAYIEKQKQEEKQKRTLYKLGVSYSINDIETGYVSYHYTVSITENKNNVLHDIMCGIADELYRKGINMDYDPKNLSYITYQIIDGKRIDLTEYFDFCVNEIDKFEI